MEKRDLWQFGNLRQSATGHTVTVMSFDARTVHADNWNTGQPFEQPLEQFLKDHEPLHEASELPRYNIAILATAASVAKSICVSLEEAEPAFCDDCVSLTLHATTDGVAVLDEYLQGLSIGESWLQRESNGTADIAAQDIQSEPGREVTLCEATNSQRHPSHWFSLLVEAPPRQDSEAPGELLEICVRDEELAQKLFTAVVNGTIRLES